MSLFRIAAFLLFFVLASTNVHADDDTAWFEIPEGTGEEIRDFAGKLQNEFRGRNKEYFEKYRAGKTTSDEDKAYQSFMEKFETTLDDVSTKLLALPKPSAKDKEFAYQRKWSKARRDPYMKSRIPKLETLVEECEKDPDLANMRKTIYQDLFQATISNAMSLDEMEPLFDRLLEYLKEDERQALYCCDPFFSRLKDMNSRNNFKQMTEYYRRLTEVLEKSKRPETKKALENLEGAVRFYTLPRRAMELKGITTDGQEIDLADLKGKIVYVDFWATWCGPCIAEMPDLHDKYKTLKDSGFEVISYSIDDDQKALKTFMEKTKYTWPTISVLQSKEKGLKDYYEYYGGRYVPKTILIGRDGLVMDVDIRGMQLDRALEQLFAEELEKKANDPQTPFSIRAGYYMNKIIQTPLPQKLPDEFLENVVDLVIENKNDRSYHFGNLVSCITGYYESRLSHPIASDADQKMMRENYLRMIDRLVSELKPENFAVSAIYTKLEALQRAMALPGKPMEFEAVLHDSKRIDIKDFKGNVVLLCICSVLSNGPPMDHNDPKSSYVPMMFKRLREFGEKYGESGLVQIVYPVNDSKAIEQQSVKADGKWLTASGEESIKSGLKNYWDRFAAGRSPCWILVDRDGKVVDTKNDLDASVEKLFLKSDVQ